ncbi:hypothetical protein CROQUDRAFT_100172 [Cronartium quercuum f. sp. fusiforme G11]|uniref:Uncharacterized protein n=1 Tax=Cronartium quercuum f. sp. fusiforme G11 TaxID=708437 RepID=A0A9P6N9W4_9BASI|nr:hypothetical protein CROQUDRAFT_100172 [Cronartium quercuum f. sp. fusiforme G11]
MTSNLVNSTADANQASEVLPKSFQRELLNLWTGNLNNTDAIGNIVNLVKELRDEALLGLCLLHPMRTSLPPKPTLCAKVTAKNANPIGITGRAPSSPKAPPSNQMINQFTPTQLIIYAPASKTP